MTAIFNTTLLCNVALLDTVRPSGGGSGRVYGADALQDVRQAVQLAG